MADTASTPPQQRGLVKWKPGQSGNPKGRPKGSKDKINELFLRDFYEAWEALGRPALLAMAWLHPDKFVQCAASLLPKDINVNVNELTDDELQSRIQQLASELGVGAGATGPDARSEAPEGQGEIRH